MRADLPGLALPDPHRPSAEHVLALLAERSLSLSEIGAALWPGLTKAEWSAPQGDAPRRASREAQLAALLLRLMIYGYLRSGGHRGLPQGAGGLTFCLQDASGSGACTGAGPLRLTDLPWGAVV